jgi:hypothetical protein
MSDGWTMLRRFYWSRHREVRNGAMQALADESDAAWEEGYWTGHEDFGHVCPGWIRLTPIRRRCSVRSRGSAPPGDDSR